MKLPTLKARIVDSPAGVMYALQILKGTELAHSHKFRSVDIEIHLHNKQMGRFGVC